ncbi:MAG: ABC transporter ATP-binding protein [Myxococcota bacterium]
MTEPLLEVSGLQKSYRKEESLIEVLSEADLRLDAGDMVSITGQSGAGKSTLLHLIGTLDAPDSGSIRYRGVELTELTPAQLADFRNRELGFVFQFHHLLPEFTALENVMMPSLIRRVPATEASTNAQRALEDVGLSHRLTHKPGELSGGEQQRVALARALVMEPPLLLADEVTGNLDESTGEEIHDLLFEINRTRGTTLVVVTHNRSLAERMPRQLVVEGGVVLEKERAA